MTIGSITQDGRVTVLPPGWVSYQTGPYRGKSWNGGDRVTTKPVKTKTTVQHVVYRKTGYRFNKRTGRYKAIRTPLMVDKVLKTARTEKPKRRVVEREPHAYNCTGFDMYDPVVEMRFGTDPTFYPSSFRAQFNEPTWQSSWTNNDYIALVGRLREEILGSEFDPGVFLAEAPQALGMIADAAQRIGKSIHYAHKGNWREAFFQVSGKRSPVGKQVASKDVAAANWLQLQYGWTPLLSDAESSAQFLATALSGTLQKRYQTRRRIREGFNFPETRVAFQPDDNNSMTRAKLIAYLSEDGNVLLETLSNPASVVWEKIPYSFVIDWFAPIGSYLQARGVARSLRGKFVFSKKVIMDLRSPYSTGLSVNNWRYGAGDLSSYRIKRWTFGRTVLDSLDVPLPSVKPLEKILAWKHCANALALLTQNRGKLLELHARYSGK